MRSSRFLGLVLVSLVLVLAFAGSAFAAPAGWTVSQISANSGALYSNAFDVSGDRIVWVQNVPGGNVWLWTPTEAAHQISQDDGVYSLPVISGDRVAWMGYRIADATYLVRTWTAASGIATAGPVPVSSSDMGPMVSGDRVVWSTQMPGESLTQVYEWTPPSGMATVSANLYHVYGPRIGGDRVTWYGSSGPAYQVYTRAAGDSEPKQLTNHVTGVAYQPDCSQERVVWVDQDESDNWAVRTWRASDDTSETLGQCVSSIYPKVSGDRVVWVGLDELFETQIFTWKGGVTTTLTAGPVDRAEAVVSGDRVVWLERWGGLDRVCTWKAGDASVTQLSDGTRSCYSPRVSGDRVAWTEKVDGANQVFSAAPAVVPTSITTAMTRPSVSPSRPKRGKYATFSAYLTPGGAGAAGSRGTLQLYHSETKTVRKKIGGKWRKVRVKYWRLRKTAKMSGAAATGDRWKLSARVKLAYKGSWRATVKATAAGNYLVPAAKTLSFTAR